MNDVADQKVFGVIGNPVDHSLSPVMHNAGYQALGINATFKKYPALDFKSAVSAAVKDGAAGLAVTAPFKSFAFNACRETDEISKAIASTNTLMLGGILYGSNTDVPGMAEALAEVGFYAEGATAFIIGSGGTARAAIGAMAYGGCSELIVAARNPARAERILEPLSNNLGIKADFVDLESSQCEKGLQDADIIINTTPIGWKNDSLLINTDLLKPEHTVMDVVYAVKGTMLIREAKDAGCKTVSGERMLLKQALTQFEIFTGEKAPEKEMEKALYDAMKEQSA